MKPDATISSRSSTTTSRNAPPPRVELPTEPARLLSEAEYLHEQAASARAAITQTLNELSGDFKRVADPHRLTRDHPWLAVSGAAVAGFVAALTLVPTKEEQALRKLAGIEAALKRERRESESARDQNGAHASDKKSGWLKTIALEVFHAIRPALISLITAGLQGVGSGEPEVIPAETKPRSQTAEAPVSTPADISSPS